MGKRVRGAGRSVRTGVQLGFTALSNGYLYGFARGSIYKGPLKQLCLPGLHLFQPGGQGSLPCAQLVLPGL